MSDGPPTADADQFDRAAEAVRLGAFDQARSLLLELVGRAPADYQPVTDDPLTIRFWDLDGFVHHAVWMAKHGQPGDVVWERAVYPVACYYLGMVAVREGKPDDALGHLDRGEELEPGHPLFALQRGQALHGLGRLEEALGAFHRVGDVGPFVTPRVKAMAHRGEGVVLADLGRLDEAEGRLRESQRYEPNSPIARDELLYVYHLRADGLPSPVKVVPSAGPPVGCGGCKSTDLAGGKAAPVNGKVVFACPRCLAKPDAPPAEAKPWWQFWK
jgi:tetratricopeptide (TPR) repeat protein